MSHYLYYVHCSGLRIDGDTDVSVSAILSLGIPSAGHGVARSGLADCVIGFNKIVLLLCHLGNK